MSVKAIGLIDLDERGKCSQTLGRLLAPWHGLTLDILRVPANIHPELPHLSGNGIPEFSAEKDLFILIFPSRLQRFAEQVVNDIRYTGTASPMIGVALDELQPDEARLLNRLGVTPLICKPDRLHEILPHICRLCGIRSAEQTFRQKLKESLGLSQLIGESPRFLAEVQKIPAIARCNVKVLLCGETGTGKEIFARAIHYLSPRAQHAFVAVNCGAIPIDLVENELFGHERGAYTGADTARDGLVHEAKNGTLFLDEIDSLPLPAQVKLLRLIQENEYRPLGSATSRPGNVRVITATNTDLEKLVRDQRFRKDLYYRLNVITLSLPALRERPQDIRPLAGHFLKKYADLFQKTINGFSDEAILRLGVYEWPGNVRELENQIERAVALTANDYIMVDDLNLPESVKPSTVRDSFESAKRLAVERFESTYLREVLQASQGNISQAARLAGKNRRAFWELMKKNAVNADQYRTG